MAADYPPEPLSIGEVLKQARQRAGMEISVAEEKTKIRTRYLRALEGEEWDALPGDVYTKSFLRTYAQLLGLDAEALVDEFRRGREDPRGVGHYPITEPMLRTRRRADQTGRDWAPGRGLAIGVLIVILLLVLLVLGLTGGEDGGEESPAPEIANDDRRGGQERGSAEGRPAALPLILVGGDAAPVQLCLLNGDGKELFDDILRPEQQLEFDSYSYQLRFPEGLGPSEIDVIVDGEPLDLGVAPSGSIGYRIAASGKPSGPDEVGGSGCP